MSENQTSEILETDYNIVSPPLYEIMVVPSHTTSRRGLDGGVNVFSFYISVSLVLVLILSSDMFGGFF